MENFKANTIKNEKHYDEVYSSVDVRSLLSKISNVNDFLNDATKTDTSWVGLYHGQFQEQLKGKVILELGCGDCLNAAVMAKLGAHVYANDISQESGDIIKKLNANTIFQFPIKFIKGDFLKAELKPDFYDIVIGKSFVHHLTNEQEIEFIKRIVKVLKPKGIVRFFEPAINWKLIDNLRWLIPMPGRPSKMQKNKFKEWKLLDPHPDRDNSSNNYMKIGETYFEYTLIVPVGTLERFCRLVSGKYKRPLRRFAYKVESYIPKPLNMKLTRAQLIEYRYPKKPSNSTEY